MDTPLQEVRDIHFLLKNLDNHIQRYIHQLYKRKENQDCSIMNMWVCDFLYDNRDRAVYQKDVEAEFFINRATASKMLSLMEEKGLIHRTTPLVDGRLKQIELLPDGLALHALCQDIRSKVEYRLTASLSPQEVALFKTLCRRMITSLETPEEPESPTTEES